VTVAARREGVEFLIAHGIAQRRACILLQLQRSTFTYQARPDCHAELVKEVHDLAQRHPRYGYRRVWACLFRSHGFVTQVSQGQRVHPD
jgi:putative transposase